MKKFIYVVIYIFLMSITTHVKAENYVNLNGVTGLEVKNRDCKAYAEAIMRLYKDKKMYREYSRNAKERVTNNFIFKIFRKNIVDMIEGL